MSTTSIDSTNFTLAPDTNRQLTMSAGFTNLEVVNVGGVATVAFKIATSASAPTCNSNGNDTWILPAAAGASRQFTFTEAPTALTLALAVAATNHVAVTAW